MSRGSSLYYYLIERGHLCTNGDIVWSIGDRDGVEVDLKGFISFCMQCDATIRIDIYTVMDYNEQ